ncbi:MAG: hypothetical protein Q8R11_01120 [bacterium]|nr:hypothetical protein [bacterium]
MIIRRLIWDDWNTVHIVRHVITQDEVEEICSSERNVVTRAGRQKIRVVGRAWSGKYVTVFLVSRGRDSYYVVTARASTNKEKMFYRKKVQ